MVDLERNFGQNVSKPSGAHGRSMDILANRQDNSLARGRSCQCNLQAFLAMKHVFCLKHVDAVGLDRSTSFRYCRWRAGTWRRLYCNCIGFECLHRELCRGDSVCGRPASLPTPSLLLEVGIEDRQAEFCLAPIDLCSQCTNQQPLSAVATQMLSECGLQGPKKIP